VGVFGILWPLLYFRGLVFYLYLVGFVLPDHYAVSARFKIIFVENAAV